MYSNNVTGDEFDLTPIKSTMSDRQQNLTMPTTSTIVVRQRNLVLLLGHSSRALGHSSGALFWGTHLGHIRHSS